MRRHCYHGGHFAINTIEIPFILEAMFQQERCVVHTNKRWHFLPFPPHPFYSFQVSFFCYPSPPFPSLLPFLSSCSPFSLLLPSFFSSFPFLSSHSFPFSPFILMLLWCLLWFIFQGGGLAGSSSTYIWYIFRVRQMKKYGLRGGPARPSKGRQLWREVTVLSPFFGWGPLC